MKAALADFATDLTAAARAGQLDPVTGREAEIARVLRVLGRKTKNNPVLLGEPGVGKTAIVEGIALRIVEGRVPRELLEVTLFSLNLGSLVAGTGYRGDFEQRLQDLVAALRRPGLRRLLFVDELHLLGKAGRSEGGLDAGNLLKPLLARGELPCIGASTPTEWAELVARDPALERRFQPVIVVEPTATQTLEILRGLRLRYQEHHGVEITDDALQAAVTHAAAIAPTRRYPDKAIDLLDEACAMRRLTRDSSDAPGYAAMEADLARATHVFDLIRVAQLRRQLHHLRDTMPILRVDASVVAQVSLH